MAFFIAHELGHALGAEAPCSEYGEAICESECDHYGANIVLRRVFTGEEYVRVVNASAGQLRGFMSDPRVEGFPECGKEWSPDMCPLDVAFSRACGYPPRSCRVATIRAAMFLQPKPMCTSNWVTSSERICE